MKVYAHTYVSKSTWRTVIILRSAIKSNGVQKKFVSRAMVHGGKYFQTGMGESILYSTIHGVSSLLLTGLVERKKFNLHVIIVCDYV